MHLLLNSERETMWAAFEEEVTYVAQARAVASGAYQTLGGKHGGDQYSGLVLPTDGVRAARQVVFPGTE